MTSEQAKIVAAAATAVAVALLLIADRRGSTGGKALAKLAASTGFVAFALAAGALGGTYGRLVLAALVLSWLGDALLLPRGAPAAFRAGLASFLAAHLAYAAAFAARGVAPGWALAAAAGFGLVGWRVLVWLGPRLPAGMRWPVRAYVAVLTAMVVLALGCAAGGGGRAVFAGAFAFYLSDLSVALDRFVRPSFATRLWGLPLYYAAQLVLASSVAGSRAAAGASASWEDLHLPRRTAGEYAQLVFQPDSALRLPRRAGDPRSARRTSGASSMQSELEHFKALDGELVETARSIKVLSQLAWDPGLLDVFLASWRAGDPRIPEVSYPPVDDSAERVALEKLAARCDVSHPIGRFLHDTAESYAVAAKMLECMGQPAFAEHSIALYGAPTQDIIGGLDSALAAAKHLMRVTEEYAAVCAACANEACVSAEQVAAGLRRGIEAIMGEDSGVEVVVDPKLGSKAAAGAKRVRVRAGAHFTALDIPQLLHHEIYVHTLTALNGRYQPNLQSLSLGAPRTTRTQEGLAIFAELITNSMDLSRMRRIAARVVAIHLALDGGDFIDVFRYFLECGQNEEEAYHSAARVFRGGDPRGGIPFTKDVVYLKGFVRVHDYLQSAIHEGTLDDAHHLFAGRLTPEDALALGPFFESGWLVPPRYEPPWLTTRSTLATFLLYDEFTTKLHLGELVPSHA